MARTRRINQRQYHRPRRRPTPTRRFSVGRAVAGFAISVIIAAIFLLVTSDEQIQGPSILFALLACTIVALTFGTIRNKIYTSVTDSNDDPFEGVQQPVYYNDGTIEGMGYAGLEQLEKASKY